MNFKFKILRENQLSNSSLVNFFVISLCVGHFTPVLGRECRSWIFKITWPPTRNCACCGQKLLELWCSSLSPAVCDVACLQLDPISHFSFSILQPVDSVSISLSFYFRFVETKNLENPEKLKPVRTNPDTTL